MLMGGRLTAQASREYKFRKNMYLHRTLCSVLEDMRACNKTRNYAALESLIEEVQIMGNRMEAGLGDKRDYERMQEELPALRKEYKDLNKKVKKDGHF